GFQLPPPSIDFKIVPLAPTAHPIFFEANATSYRASCVPLFCDFQDVPLSVVSKIVPPLPTAIPIEEEANATPKSDIVVPLLMSLMAAVALTVQNSSPDINHKETNDTLRGI